MNMLERIARDLRFVQYGVPIDRPMDAASPWLIYAKTALAALREPTEDMRKACHGEPVSQHWSIMIDAAQRHPR